MAVDDERGEDNRPGERGGQDRLGGQPPKRKNDKRTAILIVLTAAGVLIGWLSLRRGKSASSTAAGGTATNAANYPAASPGTGSVAGYDPSSQVGFEAMIANLQGEVGQLIAAQTAPTTGVGSPTPVSPHLPRPFPYIGIHQPGPGQTPSFIGGAAGRALPEIQYGGAIYQVDPGGALYHLNPTQYASLGKPKPIPV